MSHTPGTWASHDDDYCPLEIYGDREGPMEDGRVHGTLVCTIENERDVPIIKAAPDLLAACKAVLEWGDRECMPQGGAHDCPFGSLEKAVAKAEGR